MRYLLQLLAVATMLLCQKNANADTFHYRATFNDDPSTTISIGWSGKQLNNPEDFTIYWGCTDYGQDIEKYEFQCEADKESRRQAMSHFFKKFTGLSPKTVYYFVIKDNIDGTLSPRMSVMTLSDSADDPISFIAGGDSRTGAPIIEPCDCRNLRQRGNRLVAKVRADVIFFNGDFTLNRLGADISAQEWIDWFKDWELTIAEDGRITPIVVALGNHEGKPDMRDMFDVPNYAMYSAMNFNGNLFRLYTLNSEVNACYNQQQLDWLKNDLEMHNVVGNTPYWKFAQYHKSIFSQGQYDTREDAVRCWMPLFEEYKVRLAMESHTHIYKVSYPMVASDDENNPTYYEGFVRSDGDGITFIGEGNWGAPYRNLYSKFGTTEDAATNISSFFFVTVSKEKLSFQSVDFSTNINGVEASMDDELGSCLPEGVKVYEGVNGSLYERCASGVDCLNGVPACGNGPTANTVCDTNSVATNCKYIGLTTAIIQNLNVKQFADVYPNPVTDILTVDFNKSYFNTSVEVYNSLGKLCSKRSVDGQSKIQFDVATEFCEGVNFLYIRNEQGIQTHKIIKQ